MLTKKFLAVSTVVMASLYFLLLYLFLPVSVVEPRIQSELAFLFIFKIAFLSISAAIVTATALVIVFRREFITKQFDLFNRYKYLLWLLVRRDFISRYRKSLLGVLWSVLNPLLTMLVVTMVFSYMFARDIVNFPVYLLSGQIIYNFFNESTSLAMRSITSNAEIIKKVYVPKYIFPASKVLSSLVNLFFSFLAFLFVFIVTNSQIYWTILLIPIPIVYTFVFSLGVGMLLSSLSVFFQDITYLYGVFMLLLMYLTPIFYPVALLPDWVLQILGLNPIYHFVDYFRNLVLYGIIPGVWENTVCIGFSMASLCIGMYVSMSQQDKYILYL